jgi:hypothetical protein
MNRIILVPLFTIFIILSFLISLSYGINYNPKIYNNTSSYLIKNVLIFISTVLIILLIVFNFIIFKNYTNKPFKLIV